MRNALLVENLKGNGIIRQWKNFLIDVTGLDFEILHLSGSSLQYSCSCRGQSKSSCLSQQNSNCLVIGDEILNECSEGRRTASFHCPARYSKIIIPILVHDECVGVLFVGENCRVQLDKTKLVTIARQLFDLTNYIVENESHTFRYFEGNSLTHSQEIIRKVMRYIEVNSLKNQLSLRDVARDNAVSYYYLSHLFKKELKTTFVQFRRKIKMDLAARLLTDFRLTINQVSIRCGFDDPSYFCKAFKVFHGAPPGDFRRQLVVKKRTKSYKEVQLLRAASTMGMFKGEDGDFAFPITAKNYHKKASCSIESAFDLRV
ncbi:MAG: AraC family transcriptional regulator [Candidatus Omnitrophica bacterium]|nr:AraC family transcriptional regulator [Candidatus Omnitrophota bacterium]